MIHTTHFGYLFAFHADSNAWLAVNAGRATGEVDIEVAALEVSVGAPLGGAPARALAPKRLFEHMVVRTLLIFHPFPLEGLTIKCTCGLYLGEGIELDEILFSISFVNSLRFCVSSPAANSW